MQNENTPHASLCIEIYARIYVQGTPSTYVLVGVSVHPSRRVHLPAHNRVQGSSPCASLCTHLPARKSVQGIPRAHVLAGVSVHPSRRVHLPARNRVQGSSPRASLCMHLPARKSVQGTPRAHVIAGFPIPGAHLPTRISLHGFPCREHPARTSSRGFLRAPLATAHPTSRMHCGYTAAPRTW
ncbi:hypothetical protein B0H13DRAFT_2342767 [Mycena leptocephala]|nr:hypothetical protein B0H13DRAFT_2342767 [Mycena leptocephala]